MSLTRGAQLDHKDIEASGRVQRYYTPDGSHSIKRSRYGAKGNLVESRPLKDAKIMQMGGACLQDRRWCLGSVLTSRARRRSRQRASRRAQEGPARAYH